MSVESPTKNSRLRGLTDKTYFVQSFRQKTEKAIQLINKHEQDKYNFLKTLTKSKKFIQASSVQNDEEYFNIVQIPQLLIQQTAKVQILPFTDQVYKVRNPFYRPKEGKVEPHSTKIYEEDNETSSQGIISMNNSQVKRMSNTIRKDKNNLSLNRFADEQNKTNSIQINEKLKIYVKSFHGGAAELFLSFEDSLKVKQLNIRLNKYLISNDKIIHVNAENFIDKKWVYLRIKSSSELVMFLLRIDSENFTKRRVVTEINELAASNQMIKKLPQLQGNNSFKSLHSNQSQKKHKSKKSKSMTLKTINQGLLINNQISLNSKKNKQILQKLKKQQLVKKKQQQQRKFEEIIQKKNAIELVKQKQLKLKSKALQMKKLVEQYKLIYQEELQYAKYLIPKLTPLFILPRFSKACRQIILQRQKGMKMAWKTRILTKKFTQILKNKYQLAIQQIRNRKNRQLCGVINITTLFAKILYKNTAQICQVVILQTFKHTLPGLIISQSFDNSTNYRRSIRLIQKAWLSQFNARMVLFQKYVQNQTQSLIVKYPYFKYVQAKFIIENVGRSLAYKYLADESSKLKNLFEDYQQKLQQIKEFEQMNKKITEFNKTALKKRQKPLLEIPKKPCYPSLRYFRNISFLKTMIRSWFEIQYRKWSKANKTYFESMIAQKKKSESSQKQISRPLLNGVQFFSPQKQNQSNLQTCSKVQDFQKH